MAATRYDLMIDDVMIILGLSEAGIWHLVDKGILDFEEVDGVKKYNRKTVYEERQKRINEDLPLATNYCGTGLTAREANFVESYLCHWSAIRAYEEAFETKNPMYIARNARRLLKKPRVREAIRRKSEALMKKKKVTQEMVVDELTRIAFSGINDVAQWDQDEGVVLKPSFLLDQEALASIQEVSSVNTPNGRNTKVKLYDKQKALELLAKYLGIVDEGSINLNLNWEVEIVEPKRVNGKVVEPLQIGETARAEDPDTA